MLFEFIQFELIFYIISNLIFLIFFEGEVVFILNLVIYMFFYVY